MQKIKRLYYGLANCARHPQLIKLINDHFDDLELAQRNAALGVIFERAITEAEALAVMSAVGALVGDEADHAVAAG